MPHLDSHGSTYGTRGITSLCGDGGNSKDFNRWKIKAYYIIISTTI